MDACYQNCLSGDLVANLEAYGFLLLCFPADHWNGEGPLRSTHLPGDVRDHPLSARRELEQAHGRLVVILKTTSHWPVA